MPIKATTYPLGLTQRLESKVTELLRGKLIPMYSENITDLRITFLMDIQQLQNLQNVRIKMTDPEGIRVIIASRSGVEASLDFYYQNDDVRFSHCLAGRHLQEFAAAINALEQAYHGRKSEFEVACIDFHYAAYPYLIAYYGRTIRLFIFFKGELLRLHLKDLKKQLGHLGRNRKNISNKLN